MYRYYKWIWMIMIMEDQTRVRNHDLYQAYYKNNCFEKSSYLFNFCLQGNYASVQDHLTVFQIINAYQIRGHLVSDLDPLNIHRGPNVQKRTDATDPILRVLQVPSNLDTIYKLPKTTFIGKFYLLMEYGNTY